VWLVGVDSSSLHEILSVTIAWYSRVKVTVLERLKHGFSGGAGRRPLQAVVSWRPLTVATDLHLVSPFVVLSQGG